MKLDEKLFPKRLKECRENMKMEQEEFAGLLGCSKQYIYCLETGRRSPSTELLLKISRKTNTPVGYFYSAAVKIPGRELIEKLKDKNEEELEKICNALEVLCYGI